MRKRAGIRIIAFSMIAAGSILAAKAAFGPAVAEAKQKHALQTYQNATVTSSERDLSILMMKASVYNQLFAESREKAEEFFDYDSMLDLNGDGVMARIVIEKIGVDLPVRHGTDRKTLQEGAGHYKDSSLPAGGVPSHCLIAAHNGMNDAEMFMRLDELEEGDMFELDVLGETLRYRVSDIRIVEPDQVYSEIEIQEGKDLCTLMTCAPYGINSHRLLVTGERAD